MEVQNNDFRSLSTTESFLLLLGSILMVIGIGCFVFMFHQLIAAFVFFIGAVLFAVQCFQSYKGKELTLRRLKSIMNLSNLLFIFTGILMVDTAMTNIALADPMGSHHRFLSNMFSNWETYIQCVYNKWIILLLVAVVLELYTTHRISHELSKKNKSSL